MTKQMPAVLCLRITNNGYALYSQDGKSNRKCLQKFSLFQVQDPYAGIFECEGIFQSSSTSVSA